MSIWYILYLEAGYWAWFSRSIGFKYQNYKVKLDNGVAIFFVHVSGMSGDITIMILQSVAGLERNIVNGWLGAKGTLPYHYPPSP